MIRIFLLKQQVFKEVTTHFVMKISIHISKAACLLMKKVGSRYSIFHFQFIKRVLLASFIFVVLFAHLTSVNNILDPSFISKIFYHHGNSSGQTCSVIPRQLHLIWFSDNPKPLRFHQLISFLAALRFFSPKIIYFWHDTLPTGDYWNYFISRIPTTCHLKLQIRRRPKEIFGNPVLIAEHQSDIVRLQVKFIQQILSDN